MTGDEDHVSACRERYRNLLEAANASDWPAAEIDPDPDQIQRLAQLVGPLMAVTNAAGICAELLALGAGFGEDEIDNARTTRAKAQPELPAADDLEFIRSGGGVLARLFALHQVAIGGAVELAALAVFGADDADPELVDRIGEDPGATRRPHLDHWIKVGTNPVYAAVSDDGEAIAIVYETGDEVGTDEEGEPTVAGGGWFWFPSDGSDRHREVPVGDPANEAERGSLDPDHDAALDAAGEEIGRYLESGRG